MRKAEVKVLRGDKWQIEGDLVLKESKIYMLKDEALRVETVWLHHDVPIAEHGGKWKTMKLVMRNYWWPGVMRDIEKYIEDCSMCQRMKNRTEGLTGKLKLSKVPEKLWTHLTVDFITKLLLVAGKDIVLVVCNKLFKMTYFVATTKETSAEELVQLFRDNMWKLYRFLESMVSDRGSQFVVDLTKELNQILGIETKLSTVFHSQTDGQMERMNQKLEQYLRLFVDHKQKDWLELLASVKLTINNKIYSVTKMLPFIANYGRKLREWE